MGWEKFCGCRSRKKIGVIPSLWLAKSEGLMMSKEIIERSKEVEVEVEVELKDRGRVRHWNIAALGRHQSLMFPSS